MAKNAKKTYLPDSSVLLSAPYALFAFDDNDVYLPQCVVDEVKARAATGDGEARGNSRQLGLLLDALVNTGKETLGPDGVKMQIISLDNGGRLLYDSTTTPVEKLLELKQGSFQPILVTRDPYLRAKLKLAGLSAEEFKRDALPSGYKGYDGRCVLYVSNEEIQKFHKDGQLKLDKKKQYCATQVDGTVLKSDYHLSMNEYVVLVNSSAPDDGTILARYDGEKLVQLRGYPAKGNTPVYGVTPRNVGQRFALDALLMPAKEAPLVILKGPAGTAKTFLSMAAALAQTLDNWGGENQYRKILLTRPNTKMDDDIGYLKGDETQKVLPALRGLIDNVDNLSPNQEKGKGKAQAEISALDSLMTQGIIDAQAMAYMRGRSICNQFIIVDETQNATLTQILSLITRVGEGSKIVILGDPDQIDHPYLDRQNNGLVYASERMIGSPLCWQVTFDESECTRSELASEAIARLTPKGTQNI